MLSDRKVNKMLMNQVISSSTSSIDTVSTGDKSEWLLKPLAQSAEVKMPNTSLHKGWFQWPELSAWVKDGTNMNHKKASRFLFALFFNLGRVKCFFLVNFRNGLKRDTSSAI